MTVLLFVILVVLIWALNCRISDNEEQIKFLRKKYENLLNRIPSEQLTAKPYVADEPVQQVEEEKEVVNSISINKQIFAEEFEEEFYEEIFEEQKQEEIQEEFQDKFEEKFFEEEVSNSVNEKVVTSKIKKEIAQKTTLESLFMGNLFNIIGGLAIVIAIGIFLKSISAYITFTPLFKTFIGLLLGFGLIVGSYKIKDDKLKKYSEIMLGTGFSVLFVTVILTTILFKTFTLPICITLSALLLFFAYYVADKQKTISMISISLIGGYLIAIMMQNMIIIDSLRWIYLLFLNLLSIIYVFKNYDKNIINIINLITTTLFVTVNHDVNIAYPISLWLIYLLADYILRWKYSDEYDKYGILNWLNFGSVLLLSQIIFNFSEKMYFVFLLIGLCIVYDLLICFSILNKKKNYETYVHVLITIVLILSHYIPLGFSRILALSLVSLLLLYALKKINKDYLAYFSYTFLTAAVINMFFIPNVCYNVSLENYIPILNQRALFFLVPILNCAGALFIFKDDAKKIIKQVMGFSLISLIFLYFIFEVNALLTWALGNKNDSLIAIKWLSYSILGFSYAIKIKYFSITQKITWLSDFSYLVGIVSMFILIITSILYSSAIPFFNMRLFAISVAILTVYLFSKWEKMPKYIYSLIVLSLIFFYLIFEINTLLSLILGKDNPSLEVVKYLTYSILGLGYALKIKYSSIISKVDWLNNFSYFVVIISLFTLVMASLMYHTEIPFFNMRLISLLFAILTVYLFSKWDKQPEYNYLSIFLGFALLTKETGAFADVIGCKEVHLMSVMWVLYAGILSLIGIAKNNKILKNSGICLSLLAVVKILVDTMQYAATFQKALTFIILGAIFMIVSYYYNKNKK